jgi:hypothetical protein
VNKFSQEEYEDFLSGYIEAMKFADAPEDEEYTDLSQESIGSAHKDCLTFLSMAYETIQRSSHVPGSHDDTKMNHAGRDFWYTRQGHGCGLWDGDWELGDELTVIAKKFRSIDVYVGDDELLYFA